VNARIHQAFVPDGITSSENAYDRRNLAFELLLSSEASTEFIPPSDWGHAPPDVELPDGTKTYGHEYEILRTIAAALGESPVTWDVKSDSWLAHAGSSQVFLASGQSNRGTGLIIGYPHAPILSPKLGHRAVDLTYSIKVGEGHFRRWQYSEEISRQALAICDRNLHSIIQAQGVTGSEQTDDYLLVTRVPGPSEKTTFTVLAGLHGPGTRAAELLFTTIPTQDLEDLASRIGHRSGTVPHFQAVFRASQFKRINGSSVATALRLVTEGCPPVRIS